MSTAATARDQAIIDLLRLYRDLEGVSSSGDSESGRVSGNADRELYRPGGTWDSSGCDTLDTLLRRLRGERPVQWWHLTERYLRCETRTRRVKAERRHGQPRLPKPGPYTEYLGHGVRPTDSWLSSELLIVCETWRPQVRLEKVRHGVAFLAKRFPWNEHRWRDLHHDTDQPVAA